MIDYVGQLQQASEGQQSRGPVDFAAVLGAMKLSQNLELSGKVINFGNSGDYVGDPMTNQLDLVQGYGSVIFLKSTLTASQEASAACPEPKIPPTTTTTTNAPTTPEVPTMIPAPFGTTPDGGMVVLLKRQNATAAKEQVHAAAHYQRRLRKVVDELTSRDTQSRSLAQAKGA